MMEIKNLCEPFAILIFSLWSFQTHWFQKNITLSKTKGSWVLNFMRSKCLMYWNSSFSTTIIIVSNKLEILKFLPPMWIFCALLNLNSSKHLILSKLYFKKPYHLCYDFVFNFFSKYSNQVEDHEKHLVVFPSM